MRKKVHLEEDVTATIHALALAQSKSVSRLANELLRALLTPPVLEPAPSLPAAAAVDASAELEDELDFDLGPPVCTVDYDDLEQAYDYVSAGGRFEHEAYLVIATGRFIHHDLEKAWYTYRDQQTREALLKWCREHRIEVVFRK